MKQILVNEELLRQALDAFRKAYTPLREDLETILKAEKALRAALEQPAVEPQLSDEAVKRVIANVMQKITGGSNTFSLSSNDVWSALIHAVGHELSVPKAQQPQLLTDEELRQIRKAKQGHDEFARAVETAVLKKNGVVK